MFKCYPCGAKVSREENTKVQAIFDKIDDDTIIPGETDYSFDLTR